MKDDCIKNYEKYFIEYLGDIKGDLQSIDYATLHEEFPMCYLISIESGRLKDLINDLPKIIRIEESYSYTLSMMEEDYYIPGDKFVDFSGGSYTGNGVMVGVIGDGISYLDKTFEDKYENSRIESLWDQTLDGDESIKEISKISYGKEFMASDIAEAIRLWKQGDDPYTIVNHYSNSNYGTNLCKVIGEEYEAGGYNLDSQCKYVIVKLREMKEINKHINCIEEPIPNIYETYDVIKALEYLANVKKRTNKPMVVYLPLETNSGGRNGDSILERFIDYYSNIKDFIIVTNSGEEGDGYSHNSGILKFDEDKSTVDIIVGKEEQVHVDVKDKEETASFIISIWVNLYDKLVIKLISPSGEQSGEIETIHRLKVNEYKLQDGNIQVISLPPRLNSSEREILIKVRDAMNGKWCINIIGRYVLYGSYDIWLPMKKLNRYNIRFKYPCRDKTLTTPSTCKSVISNMSYSQYEKNIRVLSGRSGLEIGKNHRHIAVDGTGVILKNNNELIKVGGVAVSGAILTSVVAILLQWAVVEGKKKDILLSDIKTMLIKSTNIDEYSNYDHICYGVFNYKKFIELLAEQE